jgi:hypothetical protein
MASSKAFDIAGMDSFESVKQAQAHKVLTYASYKRDENEATNKAYKLN